MRLILVVLSLFVSIPAFAFPLPPKNMRMMSLPTHMLADFDFEGIVQLSNCSGSLIRLEIAEDSDQALVLTNGHCMEEGFPNPGRHVYRETSRRRFTLMNSSGGTAGRLNANMILFGTMTGTDMAIYRVNETYAQILSRFNVRPLILSSQRPALNTPIEVISGYWSRGFRCSIETFVYQLVEGGYTMNDSIRYTPPGCEVFGGTSGSPIIETSTRQVVGVNNTGNESGRRCTMNNPCEIDETGKVEFVKGHSYGQQTYRVYSCLNTNREIDLTVPGCTLL
jgi:V8-like Glu-specific endopeptidase